MSIRLVEASGSKGQNWESVVKMTLIARIDDR